MTHYCEPAAGLESFSCPHCGAYAQQKQDKYFVNSAGARLGGTIRTCQVCDDFTIFLQSRVIYPLVKVGEPPNDDLPAEIKADYIEAQIIANESPRGAAALLRLAIQKLCVHLELPGKDINADIGSLVKKGLSENIQKALDSVRVIGNEAVHPGTIDLKDNPDIVAKLFRLVNFIAHKMLTEPREINEVFKGLPPGKLKGIEDRDGKK